MSKSPKNVCSQEKQTIQSSDSAQIKLNSTSLSGHCENACLIDDTAVLVEGPPVLVEGPPVLDEGTALSDAFLLALSTV
jgi:hypothetical protein